VLSLYSLIYSVSNLNLVKITLILQIAIPTPLYTHFDYLPPAGIETNLLCPGMRVRVPFGRTNRAYVGMLLGTLKDRTTGSRKLKSVLEIIDFPYPVLPAEVLDLLKWASQYYHHPIGEVIATALPKILNQGKADLLTETLEGKLTVEWIITTEGRLIEPTSLRKNQQRQALLLSLFQQHTLLTESEMVVDLPKPKDVLRQLQKKGWIERQVAKPKASLTSPLPLNLAQQQAVDRVCTHFNQFYPCLLDGVTGSGKTEVYLQIIQQVLAQGQQALILVPEINLTPQMVNRFKQRFDVPIAVLHSKLNDQERLQAWLWAREGKAPIVIGTRSAVWTPLQRPGLLVVDEEHDPSYKQQDHFRYSARDIAVIRAKRAQVPILLGSATPSLDSLYNVHQRRYQHLILPERAGVAVHPEYHIVDLRSQPPSQGSLSPQLKQAILARLAQQQQVLLFINRRGYAPVLLCYQCGWVANCTHCDARLIYHGATQELLCHHCGTTRPLDQECPACHHTKLHLIGQGTERVEETLMKTFPQAKILRIDSDSTRNKYAMRTMLEQIHAGEADILVGTQMLAKGHHFPKVTLVGVLNLDSGLYSSDFRASERTAQLLVQVAGRAGRAEEPGEVIIQTHYPAHPLLTRLIHHGYAAFAEAALTERQQTEFPPYTRLVLLRAEAMEAKKATEFLWLAKQQAQSLIQGDVTLWGPVAAPMEKRGDWYRAQLLLQAIHREALHRLLAQWLPTLPAVSAKLRWSLDVDPQELL